MSSPSPTPRTAPLGLYVRHLFQLIEQHGHPAASYLERHGVSWDGLLAPGERVAFDRYTALVTDVVRTTGIQGLGLEAGSHISLLDQGLFGYAIYCCANLARAIEVYTEYGAINGQPVLGRVAPHEGLLAYTLDVSLLEPWPEVLRFEVEQDFTMWHLSSLNWEKPRPWFARVELAYEAPPWADRYEDRFQCEVLFGREHTCFLFDSAHLDRPYVGANDRMLRLSKAQCDELLREMPGHHGLVAEIRERLVRSAGEYPTFDALARSLHQSPATLRRRLDAEGTCYRALLRDFRLELAGRYLVETQFTVSEIAYLAGYEEPTNFGRAFRAWQGYSPGAYRTRARVGDTAARPDV